MFNTMTNVQQMTNSFIDFQVDAYQRSVDFFDTITNNNFTTYTKELTKYSETVRENAKKTIDFVADKAQVSKGSK